jgi:hypothetical protein
MPTDGLRHTEGETFYALYCLHCDRSLAFSEASSSECAIQYLLFKFQYLYSLVEKKISDAADMKGVKLSLCVFKYGNKKSHWGVEVWFHLF